MQPFDSTYQRFPAAGLLEFASGVLASGGLDRIRAGVVSAALLEADLMGHETHGLNLLRPYLGELKNGRMTTSGEPEVVRDSGAAVTWNGRYLPGPWLVHRAIDLCLERVSEHPVVSVAIAQSHHIACLAVYLERATEQGLMMLLYSSDPASRGVAPFGSTAAAYSPDPIAVGIPTEGSPILIDISTSSTAMGRVQISHREGRKLGGPWLLDAGGTPTDDPAAFEGEPRATVLPLGGMDLGYKGFGLGLMVEALTGGLCGTGRADKPTRWGASVFLQVIDPAGFGGRDACGREMQFLTEACRGAPPMAAEAPVRVPGDRAIALRAEQQESGVRLAPSIVALLEECARECGVAMPAAQS